MSIHFSGPPPEDYSGLLQDLQSEFMECMESGDRAKFGFALEYSDAANHALQAVGMELMKNASLASKMKLCGAWKAAFALWGSCARQSFLDVVEKEVAPMWAEQEMPKRIAEFEEMRAEQQEYNREMA